MKLIYMEITHNTDDSAGHLSSLDGGGKTKNVSLGPCFLYFFPLRFGTTSRIFQHCMFGFKMQPSASACAVMESMLVNSCPCANPAELRPASLVPSDPSSCLIGWRKAISLKQHNAWAGSCRCLLSVLWFFFSLHGCQISNAPAVKKQEGVDFLPKKQDYIQIKIFFRPLLLLLYPVCLCEGDEQNISS